ncbi:MAG: DUF222 domain-containing protein, partial [Mycobacterium sp.]
RRVAAAADLGPRHVIGGDVLDPVLPACAQALAAGTINTGHITIIRGAVKKASAYLDATERAQLESTLVFIATTNTPETLQKAADHAVYLLNQDGNSPDLARHRRGLVIGAQDADGLTHIHGWVDAEFAAYLGVIRDVWARPGINNPEDIEPRHNPSPPPLHDTSVEPGPVEEVPFLRDSEEQRRDLRSDAQRTHDAIKAVLRDTLMSKRLGQYNGLPACVVVSTTLGELEAAAGIAVTGSGTLMPMADLIRLAEHAYHYLIVYPDRLSRTYRRTAVHGAVETAGHQGPTAAALPPRPWLHPARLHPRRVPLPSPSRPTQLEERRTHRCPHPRTGLRTRQPARRTGLDHQHRPGHRPRPLAPTPTHGHRPRHPQPPLPPPRTLPGRREAPR